MKISIPFAITLIITLLSIPSYCQDTISFKNGSQKKYAKYFEFKVETGTMLSDNSELGDQLAASTNYNGLDFRLGLRKTNPYDVYGNIYRRPYLGLGWYASTFQNKKIGQPHALYFFMTIPFVFEQNKKLTFDYSAAFGISFNFNPYDSIKNPENTYVGSNNNCYANIAFSGNYKFNEKLLLNASVGLKHFSNGALKKPNKGINLIPVTLGVRFKISDDEIDFYPKPIPTFIQHNQMNVNLAFGSKNYAHEDPSYLQMTFGLSFLRAFSYKYRIGLGMDVFYKAGSDLRNNSNASDFSKSVSVALVPSWEWVISKRIYAPIGLGIYLHRNWENQESHGYYERIGIMYKVTNHLSTGVTIKAHRNIADYFEWTLGYKFHKDPNDYD